TAGWYTNVQAQGAVPSDIVRSAIPGRRPEALDELLPEARLYVRRSVGRVLRDWRVGWVGAPSERGAEARRRTTAPARARASRCGGRRGRHRSVLQAVHREWGNHSQTATGDGVGDEGFLRGGHGRVHHRVRGPSGRERGPACRLTTRSLQVTPWAQISSLWAALGLSA